MKKLISLSLLLVLATSAFAQGVLERFDDPEKGHTVFIPKGCKSIGIKGGYRSFGVGGEADNDGFAILSLLNIGDGSFRMYNVAPTFNYFVANDLALGVRLDYEGYTLNTDLKLDLRSVFGGLLEAADDPDVAEQNLNLQLSSRHMHHNSWGASFTVRKYLSFFGSKMLGVFGEGRLYGKFGMTTSYPLDKTGAPKMDKVRDTRTFQTGLKVAAGAAVRFRDGSTVTVSIPLVGLNYSRNNQHKKTNDAHMSSFNFSRDIDFMALQIGYSRFIEPKKKK